MLLLFIYFVLILFRRWKSLWAFASQYYKRTFNLKMKIWLQTRTLCTIIIVYNVLFDILMKLPNRCFKKIVGVTFIVVAALFFNVLIIVDCTGVHSVGCVTRDGRIVKKQ